MLTKVSRRKLFIKLAEARRIKETRKSRKSPIRKKSWFTIVALP